MLRAITNNPELLILDEPFELAGATSSRKILDYLYNLKNTTIVVASGYIPFAEKADMILWLEKGKVKLMGQPEIIIPQLNII